MKFWERTSFGIDPNGTVRRVYTKVNPQGQERVLLDDINQLKSAWRQPCVGDRLPSDGRASVLESDLRARTVIQS